MNLSVASWRRKPLRAAAAAALALGVLLVPAAASASASPAWNGGADGLGIQPGKIKHVWLIILENKSYDASFTGLNNNTYLWKTLPGQGVLLKNYYGTGHFSLDNYISLVSGQATQPDTGVLPVP
jgi:phospholipase C